ncbi:unnamed protein product [Notodromas monacha]|uniref:Bromo domain-containing protein n=1 Tax=Notodromas monacha TaxID=399045 RepID=A0A7R9GII4_9CRUS|nr:unnamed protein product [Notodromas monacha]CAG0922488.1 unnamed protein product [Notodromas monacha]
MSRAKRGSESAILSEEDGRKNPFSTTDGVEFPILPLRKKVELLHALTDYRLQADDVQNELKNLEADSLRVEPLGHDDEGSTYWYFYGTRLYREDLPYAERVERLKKREEKAKGENGVATAEVEEKPKKRGRKSKKELEEAEAKEAEKRRPLWQVVCYTREDWEKITMKFEESKSKAEKALFATLKEDFLPEIPRLFEEKEKLQRKRLAELLPRRSSGRLERQKLKKEEEEQQRLAKEAQEAARLQRLDKDAEEREIEKYRVEERTRRDERIRRREYFRANMGEWNYDDFDDNESYYGSFSSPVRPPSSREDDLSSSPFVSPVVAFPSTKADDLEDRLHGDAVSRKSVDQLQTRLKKVLKYLKKRDNVSWPFALPVNEKVAPDYYSRIPQPMDLSMMTEKVERGKYSSISQFQKDFKLMIQNCKKYNGENSEIFDMAIDLEKLFHKAENQFLGEDSGQSSEDESLASLVIEEEREEPPSPPPVKKEVKKEVNKNSASAGVKSEKKKKSVSIVEDSDLDKQTPVKQEKPVAVPAKKRGRPRKYPLPEDQIKSEPKKTTPVTSSVPEKKPESVTPTSGVVKRGRGRPRMSEEEKAAKRQQNLLKKASLTKDKTIKSPVPAEEKKRVYKTPETVHDSFSSDEEQLSDRPKAKKRKTVESRSPKKSRAFSHVDEDTKRAKSKHVFDYESSNEENDSDSSSSTASSQSSDLKKRKKKRKTDHHHRRKHDKHHHKSKKRRKSSSSPVSMHQEVDTKKSKDHLHKHHRRHRHSSSSASSNLSKKKRGLFSGDNNKPDAKESSKGVSDWLHEVSSEKHDGRSSSTKRASDSSPYSSWSTSHRKPAGPMKDRFLNPKSPLRSDEDQYNRPPLIPMGKKRHRSKGSESDFESELKWDLEDRKRKKEDKKYKPRDSSENRQRGKSPGRHNSGSDFDRVRKETILIPPPTVAPGHNSSSTNKERHKKDFRSRLKDGLMAKKLKSAGSSGSSGASSGVGGVPPKEAKFLDPNLDNLISRVKEFNQYKAALASGDKGPNFSNGGGGGTGEGEAGPKLNMGTVLHTDFARKHILASVTSPSSPSSTDPFDSLVSSSKPVAVVESVKKEEPAVVLSKEDDVVAVPPPLPPPPTAKPPVSGGEETGSEENEKSLANKATPNLSAWFKAFGAPKRKVTPIATVKPTTPVKDAAPWAYGKFEMEKNAVTAGSNTSGAAAGVRRDSDPATTKKPPQQQQQQHLLTTVISPVNPNSVVSSAQPPPLPSPQHGSDRSPLYASSESEVQSPQTPQYPAGWASEPSPAREPQRSPHVGMVGHAGYVGSGSLSQKSPVPQEPLKVGFYKDMTQQNKQSPDGSTASSSGAHSPMTPCTPLTPQQLDSGVMSPDSMYNRNGSQGSYAGSNTGPKVRT